MEIDCKQITDTWKQYTLINNNNMQVSILNYGGIITDIIVPDKNGQYENIVLGYKHIADYADNPNYLGALIGRVAGRINNAAFDIGDKTYPLDANEGTHHLHGGVYGFHQAVWESHTFQTDRAVGIRLSHKSEDGESGYPGNVTAIVTYTLTNDNRLILDYSATTDKQTPVSLTNHTYFNLSGKLRNTIHEHDITIDSTQFLELDEELIPTGTILDVDATPFDFRSRRKLADGIHSTSEQTNLVGNGYDHYFLFNDEKPDKIVVTDKNSGRRMSIQTDQPGVTMYTANGLGNDCLLKERPSDKHLGVCFETHAPAASLQYDGLPDIWLTPGETYRKQTVFSFDVIR